MGSRCLVLNINPPDVAEVLAYVNNISKRKEVIGLDLERIGRRPYSFAFPDCNKPHRYNDCVADYLAEIDRDAENRLRMFHVCDHTMQKHLQFQNEVGCYNATVAMFSRKWANRLDNITLLRWSLTDNHYDEQGDEEEEAEKEGEA